MQKMYGVLWIVAILLACTTNPVANCVTCKNWNNSTNVYVTEPTPPITTRAIPGHWVCTYLNSDGICQTYAWKRGYLSPSGEEPDFRYQ